MIIKAHYTFSLYISTVYGTIPEYVVRTLRKIGHVGHSEHVLGWTERDRFSNHWFQSYQIPVLYYYCAISNKKLFHRVFEKLMVPQLFDKFLTFYGTKHLLPWSEESFTVPYLQPDEASSPPLSLTVTLCSILLRDCLCLCWVIKIYIFLFF